MHLRRIHFYCQKCGTIENTKEKLLKHFKNVHDETFRCEVCSKMFDERTQLTIHLGRKHSKEKPEFFLRNKKNVMSIQPNFCDAFLVMKECIDKCFGFSSCFEAQTATN